MPFHRSIQLMQVVQIFLSRIFSKCFKVQFANFFDDLKLFDKQTSKATTKQLLTKVLYQTQEAW